MKRFFILVSLICCILSSCNFQPVESSVPDSGEQTDKSTFSIKLVNGDTSRTEYFTDGESFTIPSMENENHYLLGITDAEGNVYTEGAVIKVSSNLVLTWKWSSCTPSDINDFIYEETENKITIVGYKGKGGIVAIPSRINGKDVASIGNSFLWERNESMSIYIPRSVENIDLLAIYGCAGIKDLVVDSRNDVYYSEGNCIIDRYKKKLILGCSFSSLPQDGSIEAIGGFAFSNTDFIDFTVPEGVKTLDSCALANMVEMKTVSLPSTLETIGDTCFTGCSQLMSIDIPASTRNIGIGILQSCPKLSRITVDENNRFFKSIGNCLVEGNVVLSGCINSVIAEDSGFIAIADNAFAGIPIVSLALPASISRIGDFAFSMSSLGEIALGDNIEYVGTGAFMAWSNAQKIVIAKTCPVDRWASDWNMDCNAVVDHEGYVVPGSIYSDFSLVEDEVCELSYMRYWPGALTLYDGTVVNDTKNFYFCKSRQGTNRYIVYVPYTVVEFHREHTGSFTYSYERIMDNWYLKDELDGKSTPDARFKAIGALDIMPGFDESTLNDSSRIIRTVTRDTARIDSTDGFIFSMGNDLKSEDGIGLGKEMKAYIDVESNMLIIPVCIFDEFEKAGNTSLDSGDPLWIYLENYYPPESGEGSWVERDWVDIKKFLVGLEELKKPSYKDMHY